MLPIPRAARRTSACGCRRWLCVLLATLAAWLGSVSTSAAQPYAYVLLQRNPTSPNASQSLAVIDVSTGARVTTIPLDVGCCAFNAQTLAASPDGTRVFAVNQVSGTISVIDTTTRTRVATVTVGGAPKSVAVSPNGQRLYVLLGTTIAVFDAQSLVRLGTWQPQMLGTTAAGMVISPDGSRLYVKDFGARRLAVIDTLSGTQLGVVPLPDFPANLEISPDGSTIYVSPNGGSGLWVVSPASASVVGTVSDPAGVLMPGMARVTPNGARVYTANTTTGTLSIIERASHTVTGTVSNLFFPQSLDFTADGSRAAVAVFQGVRILDTATNQVIGTVFIDDIVEGNTGTLVVPRLPPDPPTDLVVTRVTGNRVTLQWTAAPGGTPPTDYVVEGGVSPGDTLASLATGSTNPIFTFAAPGGAFFVRVRARNGASLSGPSNEVRLFVNAAVPPSSPVSLTGLVNGSSVALAWTHTFEGGTPTGVLLDVTGAATLTLPLGASELFTYNGVPPGTYTFRVRASNSAGVSAPSTPLSLTFPQGCSGVPQAPIGVAAYLVDRTVFVRWDPAASGPAPTGYVLRVTGAYVGSFATTNRELSGSAGRGTYGFSVSGANTCGEGPATVAAPLSVP